MVKNGGTRPSFPDDEAYRCLRSAEIDEFHRLIAKRDRVDFSNSDLRGVDFRKVDVTRLVIRGSYLRDADLRGLDLRKLNLEGVSLYHAKVSGTYFPENLSPEEIRMSVELGTRLRAGPVRLN
jgi:uncharacterized protein YjbI with pentapeptide repeats